MGLLPDLSNSTIQFKDPEHAVAFGALSNTFSCVMHSFYAKFAFKFDPSPRLGVGGSPANKEWWKIGIVQNVIFQWINFRYSDGSVFTETFNNAIVDSSASLYAPFYHDPVNVRACDIHPELRCTQYLSVMMPVVDVFYTSSGFGELMDPWSATGVAVNNSPDTVDMIDEPRFGARKRLQNGAWITSAEHILSFQTWLVAKTPNRVHTLAHGGPFSLIFWLTAQPSADLLSFGEPLHRFGFYGQRGITHTVNRHPGALPSSIRIKAGRGGRTPVMQGPTANQRGNEWLRRSGLVP